MGLHYRKTSGPFTFSWSKKGPGVSLSSRGCCSLVLGGFFVGIVAVLLYLLH